MGKKRNLLVDFDTTNENFIIIKETDLRGKEGSIVWEIECKLCKTHILCNGNDITQHRIKDCGCKSHGTPGSRDIFLIKKNPNHSTRIKDRTGDRNGMLVALRPVPEKRDWKGGLYWECVCDCGNTIIISGNDFIDKQTLSCGCAKASKGEYVIQQLLSDNNIPFKREAHFDTCKNPNTDSFFRFDFYVNEEYLIEFDGIQHFIGCDFSSKKNKDSFILEQNLQKVQFSDNYKNEWCKQNKIPLIRIPYTHLENLCLEDLKLATTSFRIY